MAKPNELAGTVLADRYRLNALLGSGAMGLVYEAEQIGLGRSVAVKILRVLAGDVLERFRTEALAASRINHPNAVAIFDFGVSREGLPYLVMERLRGQTLASILTARPLEAARAVSIAAQVLSALDEAHSVGVVHRDLKAENVIVEKLRDGSDFVKVVDFGIAHIAGTPSRDEIVGTPEYMAPEQIRGTLAGPRSDLYSIGVLLHEMLTGRTPFAGGTTPEVLSRHLNNPPRPVAETVSTCPVPVSDVILCALAKRPDDRFPSAREMRRALLDALSGREATCERCGVRASVGARFCPECNPEGPPRLVQVRLPQSVAEVAAAATLPRHAPVILRAGRLIESGDGIVCRVAEADVVAAHIRANKSLVVCGPPGVGKARLVLDVAERLAGEVTTVVAAPDPSGFRSPWYPILAAVESILGLGVRVTANSLHDAALSAGLVERDLPGLDELFDVAGPLAEMELAVRRREAYASAARALRLLERRGRGLLVFIDLDRFDVPSRALVRALCDAGAPVVATVSNDAAAPPGRVLRLGGLGAAESEALACRLLGKDCGLLGESVLALTGGLPGAIEQLASWVAMRNDPTHAPPRVVDVVAEWTGQLAAGERRVLQAIAAYGQIAPRPRVEALAGQADATGDALEGLLSAGVVVAADADLVIPSSLVAEVVAAATPLEVRRELSRGALAGFDTTTPPGLIGHHAEIVGEFPRAAAAFLAAGEETMDRFDDPGAATWFGRAVQVGRQIWSSGEPGGGPLLVRASLRLADALRFAGQPRLAAGCLDEAEHAAAGFAEQAGIAHARGRVALALKDYATATAELRRAIGLGLRATARDFLCEVYVDLAGALVADGDVGTARREIREAIDVLTLGDGVRLAEGPALIWRLGLRLAEIELGLGDHPAAVEVAEDTLAFITRLGMGAAEGRVRTLLAQIHEARGEASRAQSERARALASLRRLGDRQSTAELLTAVAADGGEVAGKALQIAEALTSEVSWKR